MHTSVRTQSVLCFTIDAWGGKTKHFSYEYDTTSLLGPLEQQGAWADLLKSVCCGSIRSIDAHYTAGSLAPPPHHHHHPIPAPSPPTSSTPARLPALRPALSGGQQAAHPAGQQGLGLLLRGSGRGPPRQRPVGTRFSVSLYLPLPPPNTSPDPQSTHTHTHHRSAWLVGERTFGKSLIQHLYPLPDGGALKLTVAEYLTPKQVGRAVGRTEQTSSIV